MTLTCKGCGHHAALATFYSERDERFDYWCPICDQLSDEIPRITLKRGGSVEHFYTPTPTQVSFHLTKKRNALYGGRAGVGKSWCLRNDFHMRGMTVPGYRMLILRRNFTELKDTHLDKMAVEMEKLTGKASAWRASDYTGIYNNGSRLRFGHLEDDNALKQYLSSEFDAIGLDEGATFTDYQARFIGSRLRTSKKGVIPVMRIGSNPGAMWLYRYYIAKDVSKEEDPSYKAEDFEFIPATIADNPHINLEEQEMRLNALPSEALRQMYRDGNWLAVEGQFFTDYKPKTEAGHWHEIYELPYVEGKPITEVPWIEYVRAIDWGYDPDEGVCTWFALLPHNRVIAVKEWTFRRTIPKQAALTIKEMSAGMKVRYTVAGHDMWMADKQGGESMEETFRRNGVPLIQADTDRPNGWMRVHSLLTETVHDGLSEKPMLQIYRRECPNLAMTLPMLQCHPQKMGDVRQVKDHWADTLRYFAMSRPSSSHAPAINGWRRFSPEVRKALLGGGRSVALGANNVREHGRR